MRTWTSRAPSGYSRFTTELIKEPPEAEVWLNREGTAGVSQVQQSPACGSWTRHGALAFPGTGMRPAPPAAQMLCVLKLRKP
jgi:hypothetical protein